MADPWRGWRSEPLAVRGAVRLARVLRPLLVLARIEPLAFERILAARVALELRGAKDSSRVNLAVTLGLYTMFGLLPGGLVFAVRDPFLWSFIELSLATFMLVLALFLQLGNLLLDGTDLAVLGPLPVPERTLYAARSAHVLLCAAALAGCLHLAPFLLSALGPVPWAPLALLPAAGLATLFAVAAVALLHALLLRVFGPQNHRRVTLWAQITLGAFLMGGIQLVNRLIDYEALLSYVEGRTELLFALPTAWFAGLFAVLAGEPSARHLALAAVGLAAPALAFAWALRLVRRGLIAGLSFERGGAGAREPWRTTLFQRLGGLVAPGRTERAGYDWALALSRREPAFLRTAYAQIAGFSLIGVSLLFLPSDAPGARASLAAFALYALPLVVPTVLELGAFTEHPEAVGLLQALSFEPRGRFYAGALKGLLAGTVLPVYAVLVVLAAAAGGLAHPSDLVLAAALSAWLGAAVARRVRVPLPFTRRVRYGSSSSVDIGVTLAVLLAALAAAGVHALLRLVPYLPAAAAAAAIPLAVLELRALDGALVRRGRMLEGELGPQHGPGKGAEP